MFSRIRRILGAIGVKEVNNQITVSGIPADVMTNDIARIWKTTRINIHMFSRASKDSLTFPSFFAVDVLYMLNHMIEHGNPRVRSRTLSKIRDELIENTWLVNTQQEHRPRTDISKLSSLIYTPKDYQQKFFEDYDRLTQQYGLKGFLLAAAAGSGKTYISLALAELLSADRVVIVCPKNATERVWESEIKTLYKQRQSYWIYQQGKKYKKERFAVFHYEALKEALSMAKRGDLSGERVLVVLDESHNLNEETAQRTQQFINLCTILNPTDVLPMSGTPIKALGGESIPLMLMIDPLFNEDAKTRYKKIYGRDGKRAVDILKHRMGLVSYKVEKSQLGLAKPIMKSMPVKIPNGSDYTLTAIRKDMSDFIEERFKYYKKRQDVDYALYFECLDIFKSKMSGPRDEEEFKQYTSFVKRIRQAKGDARQVGEEIKWANGFERSKIIPTLPKNLINSFKDVKSVYKYVNLKIQGEALGRILGRKRIDCHVDMVPHIDFKGICESTTKKTVVFTSFVDALEVADKHLSFIGLNPITVYGKTNADLAKSVRLFEKNEDVNPLCATYQSLSTAVPLVMADTMIMIDSPFRAYIHEQAISRIHRLGATTQTIIWECKLDTGNEPNISTRSSDILQWSQDQVQAIMGMESPFKVEEEGTTLRVSNEEFGIDLEYNFLPENVSFEDYGIHEEEKEAFLLW